jgi:Ca-activated chloride channel family protein
MVLEVKPDDGMKIAGVYGIPGEVLQWTEGGAIRLQVATIFLSKRKGAIYVALAPAGPVGLPEARVDVGLPVATALVDYTPVGGQRAGDRIDLRRASDRSVSVGLRRGVVLVNQITALRQAAALHHEKNDQEGAYQLVHALASLYRHIDDPDLEMEKTLVGQLEKTLAHLSGHQGEPGVQAVAPDRVTGLPPRK